MAYYSMEDCAQREIDSLGKEVDRLIARLSEALAEIERLKTVAMSSDAIAAESERQLKYAQTEIERLKRELKNLPSPTEDRSDQNEPNQEPDSTES